MQEMIEYLIQGGALGIVIALLWYMYKRDKIGFAREEMHNKTINTHLTHSTAAQEKQAAAQVELAKSLQSLKDVIGKCKYNTSELKKNR